MKLNQVDLQVLIKGRPVTEYLHNGDIFIEGREGSEFELQITNDNHFNIEAVVSVDGVSVVDGQTASEKSSGYVINARDRLIIPGWKLNQDAVAAFVFSGKAKSYSTEMTGSSRNNGVIGLLSYAQVGQRGAISTTRAREPLPRAFPDYGHTYIGGSLSGMPTGMPTGMAPTGGAGGYVHMTGANQMSYTCDTYSGSVGVGTATPSATLNCASVQPTSARATFGSAKPNEGHTKSAMRGLVPNVQELGTGFGKETEFQTELVSFQRGDLIGLMTAYYDNARGLKARGIEVGRRSRTRHTATTPQAFPGMNCTPPRSWEG